MSSSEEQWHQRARNKDNPVVFFGTFDVGQDAWILRACIFVECDTYIVISRLLELEYN